MLQKCSHWHQKIRKNEQLSITFHSLEDGSCRAFGSSRSSFSHHLASMVVKEWTTFKDYFFRPDPVHFPTVNDRDLTMFPRTKCPVWRLSSNASCFSEDIRRSRSRDFDQQDDFPLDCIFSNLYWVSVRCDLLSTPTSWKGDMKLDERSWSLQTSWLLSCHPALGQDQ